MLENIEKNLEFKTQTHYEENTNVARECDKEVEIVRELEKQLGETQKDKIVKDKLVEKPEKKVLNSKKIID